MFFLEKVVMWKELGGLIYLSAGDENHASGSNLGHEE